MAKKKTAKRATKSVKAKSKKKSVTKAATKKKNARANLKTKKTSKSKKPVKTKTKSSAKPKAKPKIKSNAKPKAAKKAAAKKTAPASKNTQPKKPANDWQKYLAPLYDKVLLEIQEESPSGTIILVGENESAYKKAKVLAVGKGLLLKKGRIRPLDVKEGDEVMYSSYAGTKIENGRLVIIKEEDILGVMDS